MLTGKMQFILQYKIMLYFVYITDIAEIINNGNYFQFSTFFLFVEKEVGKNLGIYSGVV